MYLGRKKCEKNIVYIPNDKKLVIQNLKSGQVTEVCPAAVESCMKPGTFHVTPIKVTEDEKCIYYHVNENIASVEKSALEKGEVLIEEQPFTPSIVRKKGGCKPCTNCGGCSW